MNISQLSPFWYEARTDNGNSYRRTNVCKYLGTAAIGVLYIPQVKNSKVGKWLCLDLYQALKKSFPKMSEKLKYPINIADALIEFGFGFSLGKLADDYINKKRAEKTDFQA